ncbi:hypothetical protein HZF05_03950 [Sphingomonas sp. CGMCC 1.13654]|uniref:Uncharacterized protein n=1 Tax=Sphingomonas chungangi TaxID=2683589 RepID=A0A838L1K0_9SPHN|nr:hypothetical protein [Sphingomonas chungangi]MBA2933241.1 hypothetical protein [Sphingomonas chungangi]MVW57911.1 hypothetical protein [Sphingomonas chungangi]
MSEIPETPMERARRKSRLRWITLGEAVAVAAVLISGLGLWMNYQDRRDARADKQAEVAKSATHAPFHLKAEANSSGSSLTLAPISADDVIQGQTIRFPPSFGLSPVTTTSDARIDADWFASALKADRKKRELPDETAGDERVPVMIETDYLANGETAKARSYYDIGYALEGHFLGGASVKLRGLSLIGVAATQDTPADQRLAGLWALRAGKVKEKK